jgi:hypothetical protein
MKTVWNRTPVEDIGQKLALMPESSDKQIMAPPQARLPTLVGLEICRRRHGIGLLQAAKHDHFLLQRH